MKSRLLVFALLFLFLGCAEKKPVESVPSVEETPLTGAAEDDLLLRLSPYLIADPKTRSEEENNTIVNYAIEQQWDVIKTRTGLYYQVLEQGEGALIKWGDRIAASYTGRYLDGEVFDRRGAENPLEFYVGNMIDGWNEGLQHIAVGGDLRLLIPSHLAYGETGIKTAKGRTIVAENAILVFELNALRKLEAPQ